jgi:hypothetical protein
LASQAPGGNLSSRETRHLPGTLAQISNLLYRRFVIGRALNSGWRAESAPALQNGILRYSRLEICATSPYLRDWALCRALLADHKTALSQDEVYA